MILANYFKDNRNCNRNWGIAYTNPLSVMRPWNYLNCVTPDTIEVDLKLSGFPHGYNTEGSYSLPLISGGMSTTNEVTGIGSIAATALAVKLALADLTGSGDVSSAVGSLIVQALADLTGSGTISDANLQAFLQAAADLSGSGTAGGSTLTALGELLASLTGSGTATGSTLTALGALAAELNVTGTGLSTANVGEAVWGALAASNNTTGTMGQKLNAAGGAADPLTNAVPGSYAPGTAGYVLGTNLDDTISSRASATVQTIIEKILRNKTITDPVGGTITVYDDDNTTILFTANIFEDAAGTTPYQGQGAERKDRLS